MPLWHDNDITAASLHFFFPARQQPPNIGIQCLGPDWQRPAWWDPAGMHTSRETALWEEGAWGGSTSPWRLSNKFQCGSSEPRTLMWFWLVHTNEGNFLPLSPWDPQCALGLMWSPDVGSCCTRCANHPGWVWLQHGPLLTCWDGASCFAGDA